MEQVDFLQNQTALVDMYLPSPAIWGDCPVDLLKNKPEYGAYNRWDWDDFPLIGTQTTQIGFGKYKIFSSTDGGLVPVSAINSVERRGGALSIAETSNNNSGTIAQAYPSFRLSGLKASMGKLWFEGCIAVSTLLTDTLGFMLGIAETSKWTLATGVPFNGASETITNAASFIGFHKSEDGLGVVDSAYSDRATSFTAIGTGEGLLTGNYAFAKLGMTCDPYGDTTRFVKFYQDNVELATAMTKAALIAMTNLKANALGPIFSVIIDSSGTAAVAYLKWLQVAQMNPGYQP